MVFNTTPVATDASYQLLDNSAFSKAAAAGLATLVTDIDEDPLTFSVVTGPSNGQLVVNEDGSFHYTPDTNFN
ncbi:MAG: Ig-like domain-containing protein [Opitutaceae bacterium]|nr:Ig-like domain-containing protein [Opitutaceae bacterium]